MPVRPTSGAVFRQLKLNKQRTASSSRDLTEAFSASDTHSRTHSRRNSSIMDATRSRRGPSIQFGGEFQSKVQEDATDEKEEDREPDVEQPPSRSATLQQPAPAPRFTSERRRSQQPIMMTTPSGQYDQPREAIPEGVWTAPEISAGPRQDRPDVTPSDQAYYLPTETYPEGFQTT